jgi:hypothetical protein
MVAMPTDQWPEKPIGIRSGSRWARAASTRCLEVMGPPPSNVSPSYSNHKSAGPGSAVGRRAWLIGHRLKNAFVMTVTRWTEQGSNRFPPILPGPERIHFKEMNRGTEQEWKDKDRDVP